MNKPKTFIVESVIMAVAILGFAILVSNALLEFKDRDRSVSVRGLAEREVMADFVIWPIQFKEMNNDLSALHAASQEKTNILVKFLTVNGISKDEISFTSPSVVDFETEMYRERKMPYRYCLSTVVTVASSKVDVVRNLMGKQIELVKQGIVFAHDDFRNQTVFSFNGLNEIKPAMIEEATRNARLAGEKFANDSESKLGKIKSAGQGLFTITDRDQNSPHIKNIRVVTSLEYFLED